MRSHAKRSARPKAPKRAAVLWGRLRHALSDPITLVALGLSALSLLDGYVWLGALVSELSFHFALGLLALAALFAVRRLFLRSALLLACASLFAEGHLPYLRATRPTPPVGASLRVAQVHAAGSQLSAPRVAAWLARARPDVASLTGLRPKDRGALSLAGVEYARLSASGRDRELLLIRRAFHPAGATGAAVPVRVGRCELELVQIDLPPLFLPRAAGERRHRIAELAREAKRRPRRIYIGHLGSGSDAKDLAPLHDRLELRDARLGQGRLPTAPASLGPLGLPVDHILMHGWMRARTVEVQAPLSAGFHRTLLATLELTEARCAANPPARRK